MKIFILKDKSKFFITLFLCLYFAVLIAIFVFNHWHEGDTIALISGSSAIKECLYNRTLISCPNVVHFPIFQYIPSLLLEYLGFSEISILNFFVFLNIVSFLGLIYLCYWTLKKKTNTLLATMGVLILLTSPLFWYAKSTFNEITAALVILAFTSSLILNCNLWTIVILSFLVAITKETAFPFACFIGLIWIVYSKNTRNSFTPLFAVLLGIINGIIVNTLFNYFRYGVWFNKELLQDKFIVNSIPQKVSSFLGIWASPNGGILFYWTSFFCYLFFLSSFYVIVRSKKQYKSNLQNIIFISIITFLILLTFSLANWWAPFGWVSWGPRLIIPWLPSILLLAIYFFRDLTDNMIRIVLQTKRNQLFCTGILFIASLPQVIVLIYPNMLIKLFSPDAICSEVPSLDKSDYYYFCINHYMWTKYPVILDSFVEIFKRLDCFLLALLHLVVIYCLTESIRGKFEFKR